MKIENNKELQYLNAQKRVKEIKGFYSHFTVMFFLFYTKFKQKVLSTNLV